MNSMTARMAVASTLIALACGAQAGVTEKKAMRSADEAIAAAATDVKSACGNQSLDVKVAWDKLEAMMAKNAAIIEKKSSPKFVILEVSDRTTATLQALQEICKEDADYKAEIAKLTKVEVTPKDSYEDYESEFALAENTLNVKSGFYMSRSAADFKKRLKALY